MWEREWGGGRTRACACFKHPRLTSPDALGRIRDLMRRRTKRARLVWGNGEHEHVCGGGGRPFQSQSYLYCAFRERQSGKGS